MIGWAKPTPVDPHNFQHPMRDDILTSVAGPASNFLIATVSIIALRFLLLFGGPASVLEPLVSLFAMSMAINVLLGVFNLIPVPPLDGSHVLRHLLPESMRRIYDTVGMFGLLLLFVVGAPVIRFFSHIVQTFLINTFLRGI
jgi:Zn-dependent protease